MNVSDIGVPFAEGLTLLIAGFAHFLPGHDVLAIVSLLADNATW